MTTFYSKVGSMIVLCLLALNLFSNPVDQRKAQEIGLHFMQNVIKSASKQATCEPVYSIGFQIGNDRGHAFYVFNINADSYVIVAGDDRVKPILGYSTEGRFDTEKVPANMMTFLNDLGKQIEYAVQNNVTVTDQIRGQWQSLSSTTTENFVFQNNRSGVQPLLTTKWDQNGFYNALCPADNDGPNGHAYAGCVATALAQIINYWEYPVHGTGTHAYTDPLYGQHTVNFATAHYRYAVMPNQIEISPQSHLPNDTMGANAIATLIYHCGVAVNMEYAPDGSSAYDAAARAALISYFGYNPYLSIAYKNFFSNAEWINLLKSDLIAGRPVYYSGSGSGGHAFVCDGYDANHYFHFNWGWSGAYNGYFTLDALTPSSDHNYSSNQSALVNVVPLSVGMAFPPVAPSNLVVTAGANNQLSALLSWENPTTTMNGTALTSLTSIMVKRNGQVIHTIQNPVIGASVTWMDTVPAAGRYSYEVYAVNENGQGIVASESALIGPMCNITAELTDSYGDGWNGASIEFHGNGNLQGEVTLLSGNFASIQIPLPDGIINCVWKSGGYDTECSFRLLDGNETELYSVDIADYQSQTGTFPVNFFTFTNHCSLSENESQRALTSAPVQRAINPENPAQQMLVHNIAGVSTQIIHSSALIAHTLGFNQYTATNYSNSFDHQLILYPENEGEQLLLEMLQRDNQILRVYDGTGSNGTLLLDASYGNASDFSPVMSSNGALTLHYQGNWYYAGFKAKVSTVSCLPMVLNLNCVEKNATYAILNWNVFESDHWETHPFNWRVEYGTSGFTPGMGTIVTSPDTVALITGLLPETTYDAYLYYICSNGDTNQIGPYRFKTNPLSECSNPIGMGTNTTNYYPINTGNSSYVFTQQIYTTEELAAIGIREGEAINRLGFHYMGNYNHDVSLNNVKVYLGNTTQSNFTTIADSIPKTLLQQVWQGRVILSRSNSGYWVELFFDTPFIYDGSNLVVALEKPNNEYGNYCSFYSHNTTDYRAINIHEASGYLHQERSNMRFCVSTTCLVPINLSVSETEEGNSFLHWIAGYNETSWNIEYGLAGFVRGEGTTVTIAGTPEWTIPNLPIGMYDFYIQSDCGNGEVSRWLALTNEPIGMNCTVIGEGTETIGQLPVGFYSDWYYSYTQQIFTAEELTAMGLQREASIRSLAFQYLGTIDQTKNPITVYLGNTSQTTFGDWVPIHLLEEVYTGSVVLHNQDWVTINFATPFVWDGVSNMVVAMLNNSGTENGTSLFAVHNTSEHHAREHCQSSTIDPGMIGANGAIHAKRNNMRFCASEALCLTPQNVTANSTDTNVTLTWTAGSNETAWKIEYGKAGFTQGEGTFLSVNETPGVVINSLFSGYYDFYVQADCGENQSYRTSVLNVPVGMTCNNRIGEGNNQNTELPVTVSYPYSYSQQIFTAAELVNMGFQRDDHIHSLAFQYAYSYNGSNAVNFMLNPVTVYLGNTAQTEFGEWIPAADLYKVYKGKVTVDNRQNDGWVTVVFTEPFAWDGTSNLVVAMLNSNGSTQGTNSPFYTHNIAHNGSKQYTSFNVIDPMNIENNGYVGSDRNNMQFCISRANCYSPQNLQMTNITANTATLLWTAGGEEITWYVEYGSLGFTRGEGIKDTVQACSYHFTELIPNSYYDVYVQADCGVSTSVYRKVYFKTLQEPASLPYNHNFENMTENGEWQLENGTQTNQWNIGTAAHHGGTQGLYISGDGGVSNNCVRGISHVYAYRSINFPEPGNYTVQYDWRNEFTFTEGYLRVFLVPAGISFSAGSNNGIATGSGGTPSGWICVDNNDCFYGSTGRQNQTVNATIPMSGIYNLVFYWYNTRRVGSEMAAAVDNISIREICEVPTGLTATAAGDSIQVYWNPLASGISYNLYRNTELIAEGLTSNQYLDRSLFYETTYCYTITSAKATCESEPAAIVCATTAPASFITPGGLTANALDNQITLVWEPVSNALEYTLYRDHIHIGTTASTTFLDSNLSYGTDYCYVITATGSAGVSAPSAQVCARTAECNPVHNVSVTVRNVEIDLQWEAPEGNSVSLQNISLYYIIYRDGRRVDTVSTNHYSDLIFNSGHYQYCVEYVAGNCMAEQVCVTAAIEDISCGIPEIVLQNSSDTNGYKIMIQTEPILGASFYRLYKNGALYREIVSDYTQITDLDVLPGREYCYTMTALCVLDGDTVESEHSNQICKTVDCTEAPLLRASTEGKKVVLEWTHEAGQYDVYRNGTCLTSSNRLSTNNYVDAGIYLQEGTIYCYEVVAHCHTGDSLRSNSICTTIDSCTVYTEWQAVVCEGETYNLHGFTVSEPGSYRQEYLTDNFCDSIVTLHLTVNPVYHILITDDICAGESYRLNGFDIPADSLQIPGVYMTERWLNTELECDSVIALHLTVHPSYHIVLTDTICAGEIYQANGFDLPADSLPIAGAYIFNRMLATAFGCDSLVTLQLQVEPSIATQWAHTACDVYTWNGHTYETSGTYVQNFTSKQGCDSVVTLQLTVLNAAYVSFSDSVCGSYIWNDQIYTASGIYTQRFTAENGCDSVETLTLTVHPTYVVSFSEEVCAGEPYQANGFDLPADSIPIAGAYVFNRRFTTAFGCDSLVTLNLQVIPQVVTEFSETATNQYTWNGHTYTQSGDYVQTFTSAHGCDSTVILHLTIVPVCEAPEGLLAVAEENRVRLSWNSSPAALYYLLFRNGVQIENSIDTVSYIDAALEYATHYCYTLKAICEHGESEMSEEACVWTLPDGIGVFTDPIRIFPNPAHTIVSVEYKYLKDIRIYNSIGQLLETVNANGEPGVHISMKNHASGVYIFKIKTVDGYEFSKRVVVEK